MAAKKKTLKKKLAKKKIAKKKTQIAMSAEDLVKGLRRRGGHLPTKASEAARKRKLKLKKKKNA